jgi:hypothetical protein
MLPLLLFRLLNFGRLCFGLFRRGFLCGFLFDRLGFFGFLRGLRCPHQKLFNGFRNRLFGHVGPPRFATTPARVGGDLQDYNGRVEG